MFAKAHLQTALLLVQAYKGEMPFVHYAKQYFSSHKKHGSRDRKQILQLCYAYFRMGHALRDWPAEKRMVTGLFLCSPGPNALLQSLEPARNDQASLPLEKKCELAGCTLTDLTIFPFPGHLSDEIDPLAFSVSHLVQPDLFIRIRPGFEDYVIKKLDRLEIGYSVTEPGSVRLPNGFAVEEHFTLNQQVVVQDLSSQRVGKIMKAAHDYYQIAEEFRIWDCCAASGGKAIMAKDMFPSALLTVSDIRSSILENLRRRFKEARIYEFESLVVDLSVATPLIPPQDLVITDVPCSGSGTWSRNPENLVTFDQEEISRYAELQRKIVGNALRKLQPGGLLMYITCSVYREENEENVDFFLSNYPLEIISCQFIAGYKEKADSMFTAIMKHI